jgi:hypothetical protein
MTKATRERLDAQGITSALAISHHSPVTLTVPLKLPCMYMPILIFFRRGQTSPHLINLTYAPYTVNNVLQ